MSDQNPMSDRQAGSDVSLGDIPDPVDAPPAPAPEPTIQAPEPEVLVAATVQCANGCGTTLEVLQSPYGSTFPANCPTCYSVPTPVPAEES